MLHIVPIPAFTDNYIWMAISRESGHCIIVDPGEYQQVIDTITLHQLTLEAILITHHHNDHTAGIQALLDRFNVPVLGPTNENIPGITHPLKEGEKLPIKTLNLTFEALSIPGHTRGHLAYYTPQGFVFTGDTLFTGTCGRLFEGTAQQMHTSLSKLATLPDHTLIYCGHEYTENSLKFAHHIEPNNQRLTTRIQETALLRKYGIPTVPAPLCLEKQTNPFLRCHEKAVIEAAERHEGRTLTSPIDVFSSIRTQKDHFY